MRKKEHIACSCRSCTRGRATEGGQFIHKQVNRKIRQRYRVALRKLEEPEAFTAPTPYTD